MSRNAADDKAFVTSVLKYEAVKIIAVAGQQLQIGNGMIKPAAGTADNSDIFF